MPVPNKCVICRKDCDPPAPKCNFCAKQVCYDCRPFHLSKHEESGARSYRVGFCFPCVKVRPVRYGKDHVGRCKHCHNEISFRAAHNQSVPGQVICPFCGAMQKKDSLPAPCARCRMELV